MSNNKFDERFTNALEELSESLLKVTQLCDDETHGEDFNTEILTIKLGHLWGKSLDEMAGDIKDVVEEMRIKEMQSIETKKEKD